MAAVPVIAIFTKYDRLITRMKRENRSVPATPIETQTYDNLISKTAGATLQNECIRPFEKYTKKKIPHITVSSELICNLVVIIFELLF